MITYEDFFSAEDVAAFKRVKHGTMQLSRVARAVLAGMVGGTVQTEGKEFVQTERGLYRFSMAGNSDNSTERTVHDRMGVITVVMGDPVEVNLLLEQHGSIYEYEDFIWLVRRRLT